MRQSKSNAKATYAACLAIVCAVSGCGDSRPPAYPTKGRVVFADGSPVKVGTIETKSKLYGVQSTASIQLDGSFVLSTYKEGDGAVAGVHDCVVVQFIQAEGITNHKPSTLGVVNPKHASYATSKLQIDIAPSSNDVVLQVEGIPKPKNSNGKSDHELGVGGHTK